MPRSKQQTSAKTTAGNTLQPAGEIISIKSIQLPKQQQPRRYFSTEKLEQLKASIEAHGILEPLIVRPLKRGKFELVAGERRLRVAKSLKLTEVPVVVRDFSDEEAYEVSLLENLQRDDLNPIDETEGILHLLRQALELSREEVMSLLNKASNANRRGIELPEEDAASIEVIDAIFLKIGRLNRESFRTNRLPLLNLPEDVLEVLRQGELEYTKAKVIARVEDEEERAELLQEVVEQGWSLSQIKHYIKELQGQSSDEVSTGKQLKKSFSLITQQKSAAWDDQTKQKKLQKLLADLELLLQN